MGESSITDVERQAADGDLSAQLQLARKLLDEGQTERGRDWLRRAAGSGSTDVKLDLGEHLLAIPPYDVPEGVRWTRAAVEDGSAEAVHRLAALAAEGVGEPQSWSNALNYLRQSAKLGHRVAAAELAGLSGDWSLAKGLLAGNGDLPDADRIVEGIDIAARVKVPAAQLRFASPRIQSVTGFLSEGECDWLIERARPALRRAQTFNPRTGGAQVHEGRNHCCIGFNVARSDVVLAIIRARIATLTGLSVFGFEDTSVLRYEAGEQFAPHYDFIDASTTAGLREIATSGQRAVTFLAYLNEGYDGGETAFPRLGLNYKGHRGDALFYDNAMPDGRPDPRTLHAGTPLRRGEKWLMSQWIRSRPVWLGA